MLRSGQYRAVLAMIEETVGDAPITSVELQWATVMASRAAANLKAWGRSVEWADHGLNYQDGEPEATGWLHLMLATALMYVGDVYRSEREFKDFFAIATEVPALARLVPDALFNHAFLQRFFDRPEAEIHLFEAAASRFSDCGRHRQALQARVEIAWARLMQGRAGDARAILDAISPALAEHGDEELRADARIETALCYHLTADFSSAASLCADLWNDHSLQIRQKADVAWLCGMNARRQGDPDKAAFWAGEAYRLAVEDWWPLQVQRIEEFRKSLLIQAN